MHQIMTFIIVIIVIVVTIITTIIVIVVVYDTLWFLLSSTFPAVLAYAGLFKPRCGIAFLYFSGGSRSLRRGRSGLDVA